MLKESYYKLLGVNETATREEIKKAYQKKVLEFHPDKLGQQDSKRNEVIFQSIQNAWEVLRDSTSRTEYDKKLNSHLSQQELPIFAEVDLDDMHYDEEKGSYFMECRCGGEGFYVTENDLEDGVERVACGSCSLIIKLQYEEIS